MPDDSAVLFDSDLSRRQQDEYYGGDEETARKYVADLEQIIQDDPNNLAAYSCLVESYIYEDRFSEALAVLNKALAIRENMNFRGRRAYCHLKLKNYSDAENDYTWVIDNYGDHFNKWSDIKSRADVRLLSGNAPGVQEDIDELARIAERPDLQTGLGDHIREEIATLRWALHRDLIRNNYGEALKAFDNLHYRSINEAYDLGHLQVQYNKLDDAIDTFTDIIDSDPNMHLAHLSYYRRSLCYFDLKQFDLSTKDLNEFIRLMEGGAGDFWTYAQEYLARAYFVRGLCYDATGDLSQALTDMRKSLDVGHPEPSKVQNAIQALESAINPPFTDFLKSYWPAIALVAAAILSPLLLVTTQSSIFFGIIVFGALSRLLRNGIGKLISDLFKEPAPTVIGIVLTIAIWPIVEAISQLRFLFVSWRLWRKGQVRQTESGKVVRYA